MDDSHKRHSIEKSSKKWIRDKKNKSCYDETLALFDFLLGLKWLCEISDECIDGRGHGPGIWSAQAPEETPRGRAEQPGWREEPYVK